MTILGSSPARDMTGRYRRFASPSHRLPAHSGLLIRCRRRWTGSDEEGCKGPGRNVNATLRAMNATYNAIAGRNVERLAALSDGIFAVAMTLLVLDLKAPTTEIVHSDHDLGRAIVAMAPRLLVYMLSFLTLGIFWIGQQTQLNHLQRSDRSLSWIHIVFLFAVTLTPFSTTLLAEFLAFRLALLIYWLNILLLGVSLFFSWQCALGNGLVQPELSPDFQKAIQRRILIGQSLYFTPLEPFFVFGAPTGASHSLYLCSSTTRSRPSSDGPGRKATARAADRSRYQIPPPVTTVVLSERPVPGRAIPA
jgi:uncharacterized membrane protein